MDADIQLALIDIAWEIADKSSTSRSSPRDIIDEKLDFFNKAYKGLFKTIKKTN